MFEGMHYFFLDESYPPAASGQKRIVIAAWAVEQHRWGNESVHGFDLFKPPVLKRVCSMLEAVNGAAIVTTAVLDGSLYRAGETDSTDDIPSMARSDTVWSMCVIFALATLILELLTRSREVGTVDIHFDPKNLRSVHKDAWQKTLRDFVVKEAKRFARERRLGQLRKLKIRRVEPVAKTSHRAGEKSDKFELGTWIADKLCSHAGEIAADKECSRILSIDMSDSVRRTTQQFDGKSFYQS